MRITPERLEALQRLARIELAGTEREALCADLEAVVAWILALPDPDAAAAAGAAADPGCAADATAPAGAPDPAGVDAALAGGAGFAGNMRQDRVLPSLQRDELLRNAPSRRDGFLCVPRFRQREP